MTVCYFLLLSGSDSVLFFLLLLGSDSVLILLLSGSDIALKLLPQAAIVCIFSCCWAVTVHYFLLLSGSDSVLYSPAMTEGYILLPSSSDRVLYSPAFPGSDNRAVCLLLLIEQFSYAVGYSLNFELQDSNPLFFSS